MYQVQFIEKDKALEMLKQSISKEGNTPSTPLSYIFHFASSVVGKF
jgi:hypothetical protein